MKSPAVDSGTFFVMISVLVLGYEAICGFCYQVICD